MHITVTETSIPLTAYAMTAQQLASTVSPSCSVYVRVRNFQDDHQLAVNFLLCVQFIKYHFMYSTYEQNILGPYSLVRNEPVIKGV